LSSRPLTLKELMTGETGRTVILGAICYQIATKNMTSGFGAEFVGDRPLHCNNEAVIWISGHTFHRTPLASQPSRL
jgi:hypothetical protein